MVVPAFLFKSHWSGWKDLSSHRGTWDIRGSLLMVQLKKRISSISALLVQLSQCGRDPDSLRLGLTQHKAPMWCSAGLVPSQVKIICSFLVSTNCLSLKNHTSLRVFGVKYFGVLSYSIQNEKEDFWIMKPKSFSKLLPHCCISHWPALGIWICTESFCFAIFSEWSHHCQSGWGASLGTGSLSAGGAGEEERLRWGVFIKSRTLPSLSTGFSFS